MFFVSGQEPVKVELIGGELVINKDSINHDHEHTYDFDHNHDQEDGHHHGHSQTLDLENTNFTPIDNTKSIYFWRITERTGEMIPGNPDTLTTDFFNRRLVEGQETSIAYLGNLGSPAESRIYFERAERTDFIFADVYWPYLKVPGKFNFMNTKTPYSNISYQRSGSRINLEERFEALLAVNFGKELNVGIDLDYLYTRGFYANQATKHMEWTIFANYLADRHRLHFFMNPIGYTQAENGGIADDNYISHPEYLDARNITSKTIPTNLSDTWNKIRGNQIYLNYHYSLGYDKLTNVVNEEGDTIKKFVPVSSIIYTFDYKDRNRRFYSTNDTPDSLYKGLNLLNEAPGALLNDKTSYWGMKNTLALSLREGFSNWAKFDLTAFITQETKKYTLMETDSTNTKESVNLTYIGAEIAKRKGNILRYDANGYLEVTDAQMGDFYIYGHIETRIPVWKDTASINLYAFIQNISPLYYENHYRSRYFCWENKFDKTKKAHFGGDIRIPHTKTVFSLETQNISDYLYFDETGYPKQYNKDIQVFALRLNQDFKFGIFNWDNQLVYQSSSKQDILPLPDFAAYSSLYLDFKIAKVLKVQLGVNAHYWTEYYSPTYEVATQQFRLQKETKVGNYPIMSAFVNCRLKQTRFFIQYYNLGESFISPPEYFSMPHYPLNPAGIKLGLSIDFNN